MLSDRQILSMQSAAARGVHPSFVHTPAAGKPIAPHYDTVRTFTAVAATDLITAAGHGLTADRVIRFTTTGTLPAGLSLATDYYVIASGLTANDFKVSTTMGGSAVDITGTGTGTHSWAFYLTAEEKAEVDVYMLAMNSTGPAWPQPTRPGSAAMIADHQAHFASPAYRNWWMDDQLSREAQYNLRRVDVSQASEATVPVSGSATGIGSAPPTAPVPPYVPPGPVADVDPHVDSGTVGVTSVVVSLSTPTGGATIYYRLNGGASINYSAPITMGVSSIIEFYATKAGYLDSATGYFENI